MKMRNAIVFLFSTNYTREKIVDLINGIVT